MIDWKTISLKDLAAYVSESLKTCGIDAYLVGGACVSIYSNNRYQSYDLDFVTYETMKDITNCMIRLGFRKKGRYFIHDDCKWWVDFVSPPVAVGAQPINEFHEEKLALGSIIMLRVEDSVKDRLAGFFHWDDKQALQQALEICKECLVDLKEVEKWAIDEGMVEKYQVFRSRLE